MKSKPMLFSAPMVRALLEGRKTQTRRIVKGKAMEWLAPEMFTPEFVANPENHMAPHPVGSEIWVRETWNGTQGEGVAYRATEPHMNGEPWRPSIFMPRWASRITLKVTDVRVQLLQDISEGDAKAEGVFPGERSPSLLPHQRAYRHLWNEINGHGSWDANPWVWAYTFEVVK